MTGLSREVPNTMNQSPPLAGLRIIAVEQFGAGPFGTCSSPTSGPR